MKRDTSGLQRLFPTIDWAQVEGIAQTDVERALQALQGVLQRYFRPLQMHLCQKFEVDEDQAADWLQDFVHRKVLLEQLLKRASRERGKFRTFVLFTLDRFVISEWRRAKARRRMPEGGIVSLEELRTEQIANLVATDSVAMAPSWTQTVIEETLRRMEAECAQKGRASRWNVFKARLLDPLFEGAPALRYEELQRRFEFSSPAEAGNALITAKRMFHRLLREVVAEYAGEGADAEAEIRELRRELGRVP